MTQWSLEPLHSIPDKTREVLEPLQALQQGLANLHVTKGIELQLRIRSNQQSSSPALQNVLCSLSSAVSYLRVLGNLIDFAQQSFPLIGIRVLAFCLPNRFDLMSQFQAAVQSLPQLREIQLFTSTVNNTKHANTFLRLLESLPVVTSLRVATSGCPLILATAALKHISRLELSWKVSMDHPLSVLSCLCLQDIRPDLQAVAGLPFDGYETLFAQITRLGACVEVFVQKCSASALLDLPYNVQHLSVSQDLQAISATAHSFLDCSQDFSRLLLLKVLQLGNFLTDHVVSLLFGLVMPHLHTFGFQLTDAECFDSKNKYLSVDAGQVMLTPSLHTTGLAAVFPALQHLKIVYTGNWEDHVKFQSEFISQKYFPNLKGLTYTCKMMTIEFVGMSPSCYIVEK